MKVIWTELAKYKLKEAFQYYKEVASEFNQGKNLRENQEALPSSRDRAEREQSNCCSIRLSVFGFW